MAKLNSKWGIIDKSGHEVISFIYDAISDVSEHEGFAEVELNGRCGLIDKTGREVIPCIYDECTFNEGLVWVELNGKEGCIDLFGNEMWLEEQ